MVADAPPEDLAERLRQFQPGLLAVIVRSAQQGNWRAASWLLERADPALWAKPSRSSAAPPSFSPPSTAMESALDELDALRERRLRRMERTT